jgi:hypothetical protein
MNALKAIFDEAVGLFVDDGAYAGAIVAWLVVVAVLVRYTTISPNIAATLLFLGLAAILAHGAWRKARK